MIHRLQWMLLKRKHPIASPFVNFLSETNSDNRVNIMTSTVTKTLWQKTHLTMAVTKADNDTD